MKSALVSGGPYTIVAAGVATPGYTNTGLANGTVYHYVVSATNSTAESADSAEVSVQPVSQVSTSLSCVAGHGRLQLAWPPDHTGWRLQSQTNALTAGLGTNWVTVAGSAATNQVALPPEGASGSVFFRLVYP